MVGCTLRSSVKANISGHIQSAAVLLFRLPEEEIHSPFLLRNAYFPFFEVLRVLAHCCAFYVLYVPSGPVGPFLTNMRSKLPFYSVQIYKRALDRFWPCCSGKMHLRRPLGNIYHIGRITSTYANLQFTNMHLYIYRRTAPVLACF